MVKVITFGWQSWDGCVARSNIKYPSFAPLAGGASAGRQKLKIISRGLVLFEDKRETVLVGVVPDGKNAAPKIYFDRKIKIVGNYEKKDLVMWRGRREDLIKEFLRRAEKNLKFKHKKCGNYLIYYTWPEFGKSVRAEDVYNVMSNVKCQMSNARNVIFLLDDGWERKDFGEELAVFAEKIKKMGFVPGIWVAPFLKSNDMYSLGKKLSCFDFFKLDFLYKGVERLGVEKYRKAIEDFKKGAGKNKIYMGCGAPILESLGLFDMVRGSSDSTVYPIWTYGILGRIINVFYKLIRLNERVFVKSFESFIIRKEYFGELENFISDGLVWGENFGIEETIIDKYYSFLEKNGETITLGDFLQ